MPEHEDLNEQQPIASWKVGSAQRISFPVGDITETGGNRIVRQIRTFRDGAKLDDTGSIERSWSFDVFFNNSIKGDGAEENAKPLYPGALNDLIRSFDEHETGDLTLPTIGQVRARAETYRRIDKVNERGEGTVSVTFVQDNEDALDRAQLTPPTLRATVVTQAEDTVFSVQSQGAWDDDAVSITQAAIEIETAMQAPGRAANDVQALVRKNRAALARVVNGQRKLSAQVGGQFHQPRGSEAERNLRRSQDRQASAVDERNSGRPRTRAFRVDVAFTNIFDIAARFDQDASELLDLNDSRIADPFQLRRGDVVRVFETRPR